MRRVLTLLLLLPLAATADSAKLLGKFGDWESFTYAEKGGKVCYVASQPKNKGRANAHVTVTHRTADHSVGIVGVSQAIVYRKDAAPVLEVGGTRFELYVSGDSAWARNDKAVVAALLKGKSFTVHGLPAKGDAVDDAYSLDGFARAYAEIAKACGVS